MSQISHPTVSPAAQCLVASLALHIVLVGALGWVLTAERPQAAPLPGTAGVQVIVVQHAADTDTISAKALTEASEPELPDSSPELPAEMVAKSPAPDANPPVAANRLPALSPTLPPRPALRPAAETQPRPLSAPIPPNSSVAASAGAWAAPRALLCPAPPYPPAARRAGKEGAVRLRVVIAADGRVTEAVVVESSGRRDFDHAARDTILRQWRYQPARRGGLAVTAEETVRIEFRLSG